jgi:4-amino-4-deoxy-L-arabinose transferase-like glycosyltransferase
MGGHRSRSFHLFALGIVLLTVLTRLPSELHPQAIDDENMYSVVANAIVDGGRPYIDVVDRKPPLLFWTYAAVFEAAGEFNWKALHEVAVVWTLLTMAGLYVIGARLFNRETGLIAALLYSVFQPWGNFKDLAFNGEVLMNLPIVWAWAIGFRRSSSPVRPELLASGALLCAGFLLKQPAAIAAVPLGIYLLLPSYRRARGVSWTVSITHATLLTIGFFATLGGVAVVLWKQNILGGAFYWTVEDHSIPHVFWTKGVLVTLVFLGACLPLAIGAAMGARRDSALWRDKSAERTALLGLLVVSVIGVSAGARFYPHYYIQLIPPLALLAAPFYAQLWSGERRAPYWLLRPKITYIWLTLTVITFSVIHWKTHLSQSQLSEGEEYISRHSTPDDRIFVWGQRARIYLNTRRRPACRYAGTFPLTGYIFGGLRGVDTRARILPGAWNNLEEDFAKHPPRYIVGTSCNPRDSYSIRDFPILAKLLAQRYRPVARTDEGVIYALRTQRISYENRNHFQY